MGLREGTGETDGVEEFEGGLNHSIQTSQPTFSNGCAGLVRWGESRLLFRVATDRIHALQR